MTIPSETQSLILTRAARRPGNIALPLPDGLHGAAAKKVVGKMIARGWLEEVKADLRRREPLWCDTGDGHGTTLVVAVAGLLAIGIEPVVVQAMAAIREHAANASDPKPPTQRGGTKQAMLIAMLQAPDGASIEEIMAATGWQSHTVRGAIAGGLKKKLGLEISSEKDAARGRFYRLPAA